MKLLDMIYKIQRSFTDKLNFIYETINKSWLKFELTDDVMKFKCQVRVWNEHAIQNLKKEIWRKIQWKDFTIRNFSPELNLHT